VPVGALLDLCKWRARWSAESLTESLKDEATDIVMRRLITLISLAAILSILAPSRSRAQVSDPNSGIQYSSGQDVVPAFEGWQRNTDGTYTFLFGYFNRNFEEEIDVPIGPQNGFEPGNPDRGQPSHFYTRRHFFVYKVIVPKDWPADRKLIWTLTTHGRTNKAKGWLEPEWELNNGVISENTGSSTVDWSNEAPAITGSGPQTARLGEAVKLTVTATDDGLPKPKAKKRTAEVPGAADAFNPIPNAIPAALLRGLGLDVKWILYRGPAPVSFDPPSSGKPVFGKPVESTTSVHFKVPGDYLLRAIASDGALETPYDVAVKVLPAP
jgi:hypothetical protein